MITRLDLAVLTRLAPQVRANPRLQGGLALIAAILLGWLVLSLDDLRDARVREMQRDHERLAQIKQLAKQQAWTERAADAARLHRVLAAELPSAASAGLAQAQFQTWLQRIVAAQGQDLRVDTQVPAAVESVPGVVQVTSVVSGTLAPTRVVQMLHRIESHSQLVTVPVATIRDDGANQTFSLTVRGFYRLPADATEHTP